MFDTDVILLDEPFGALDAQTKLQMQEWLLQLWSDFGKTVVFVTHDVDEAIYLSDEVHVMATRPGRIVETIPVPIARPRPRSVTLTPEFIAIKERCLQLADSAGHDSPSTRRRDMTSPGMTVQDTIGIAGASRDGARAEPALTLRPAAQAIRRLPVQQGLAALGHHRHAGRHSGRHHRAMAGRPRITAGSTASSGRSRARSWHTLITFFTDGDAFTDISFTFRSTIIGFLIGTRRARCSVCRSGGREIMRPSCSPSSSVLNRCRSSRWRRLSILVFGIGLSVQGRDRDGADARRLDAHRLCRRQGGRSGSGAAVLFARRQPHCRCSASWSCRSACRGSSRCCA